MKKILFLFLFLLAINSCKDDEGDVVLPDNEYTPKIITETYGSAKLVGFVKDKSGNPLSDVKVFFGEEKTLTKADGSYQLNSLSSGSNKRIWFQKSGYASTQKLANINEELPNRIDASLFPIDITTTMSSDGGKIEDEDFSVEIQPGGFVYSDGSPVDEDVTIEVTAFLTSEDEFLNAFPGDFKGTRVNGSETAIESFGFIDVVLKVESGEPVQLAEGVTAIIKIKAPENAPATIPMWYYDEDKAKWLEERTGSLDNGFYKAEVSHFTKWNWDRPYEETSKIVGRVIDNNGNPIEGASLVQKGITYRFQNSKKTDENGEFELLTPESNESEIEAQFDIYGSTIVNFTTSSNQGQVNNIGDITIDVSIENLIEPYVSNDVLYIALGQTEKIRGKYFGEEKRAGYKLLLNGNEVETTTWQSDLIEFVVPNGITQEGIILIDRDGTLSREVNYIEGDWTCDILGKLYDNNDLPFDGERYYFDSRQRSLKELPNCIGNLQNLERLLIERSELISLPESFGNLKNLQELNLDYNLLTTFPESFDYLQNLEELWFGYNELSSLPESIDNLKNLKLLRLSVNQLGSLPESIGNLQNLIKLYLNNNELNNLPESIGNLQNLEELILNHNQLKTLPESIGNLQNLEKLELVTNQLTTLPESIGNLQNLQKLTIPHNELSNLPESISILQKLIWLNIDDNQLSVLPGNIGNLNSLEWLMLNKNQLSSLPESVGNLNSLEWLMLNENQLSSLPESVGNLQNLEELNLNHNQLKTLPESIGNLQNLKLFSFGYNQLSDLPQSICILQNLEKLVLDYNQLSSLPESIGDLKQLEHLWLNHNQLSSLPESVGNLQNLEELNLNHNQLKTLPESIGNLQNLKTIRITFNQLSSLPETIKNLKINLHALYLTGNNFSEVEKAKIKGWLPDTDIYW